MGLLTQHDRKATQSCKCGYYGHPTKECRCTPYEVRSYLAKISGPLLDRIDIHIELPALTYNELSSAKESGKKSATIRDCVLKARQLQRERYKNINVSSNMALPPSKIKKFCPLSQEVRALLERALDRLGLSARAYDKILRVARTIADLDSSNHIKSYHISEAISYRSLDRQYWE
ncbi:MAG: ATP-binding protein [bacterium]